MAGARGGPALTVFLMILNPGYLVGSPKEVKNKHCYSSYFLGTLNPDLGGWCPSTGLCKNSPGGVIVHQGPASWERGFSLNYLLRLLFWEDWLWYLVGVHFWRAQGCFKVQAMLQKRQLFARMSATHSSQAAPRQSHALGHGCYCGVPQGPKVFITLTVFLQGELCC